MQAPTFIAPKGQSTPIKKLTPDTYVARCYQMIMLGTQDEEFQGKKKSVFKIWLGWEFPTEMDSFGDDTTLKPYTMGKEYSFFMNDKATLRKDLESWRGEKWTDEAASTFNIGVLLGKPCMISVQSYIKKNGEDGVKIGTISKLMKSMSCPELITPIQALTFDEFDRNLYDSLPNFLKDRIGKSPEYQAMNTPKFQSQAEGNQELVDGLFDKEGDEPPF